eukprot:176629-Prymnesium_polylepis.1
MRTLARPAAARRAPVGGSGGIRSRAATKGPPHLRACRAPFYLPAGTVRGAAEGITLGTTA